METQACQWCGCIHTGRCSLVKAIEYFPDGTVKRVEFVTPGDYMQPLMPVPLNPFPAYVPPNVISTITGPASTGGTTMIWNGEAGSTHVM